LEKIANNTNNKLAAYKVLFAIALVIAALAIVLLIVVDRVAAYSSLLGGTACLLPNLLFARFAFRYSAAESVGLAVRWFYIGEVIKIIVTILIFALSLLWIKNLNFAAMFITYIVALMLNIHGLGLVIGRTGD
jgi:ATP synthase protein I